ncbi:MAG: hypothetical protein HQK83_01985 [Fibrobacteria bacterium]|nr:hypothetical protein [Fibrobacteria bacterium]
MRFFWILAPAIIFSSCLYTTHHFNTGKTLSPGKTRVTLGLGHQRYNQSDLIKTSLDYRLGIFDKWGPFPGGDIGLHLEVPTNPGTMEFDMKLAMPGGHETWYRHSLSAGWGIGMWADNTLFMEYGASTLLGMHILFANFRASYIATQFFKVFEEDIDSPFTHRQRMVYQSSLGLYFRVYDIFLFPDYVIPQFITSYPEIPAGLETDETIWKPQFNVNIGMAWRF